MVQNCLLFFKQSDLKGGFIRLHKLSLTGRQIERAAIDHAHFREPLLSLKDVDGNLFTLVLSLLCSER